MRARHQVLRHCLGFDQDLSEKGAFKLTGSTFEERLKKLGLFIEEQEPEKQTCGAKTRRGTECQCKPLPNGRCKFHGGMSTGPTTLEGRENISRAQKRRWDKYRRELASR